MILLTLLVSLGLGPATRPPTLEIGGITTARKVSQTPSAEEITFCQLADDPERYNGKVVRFRARSVWSIPDTFFIYSQQCESTHINLSFVVDGPETIETKRLLESVWDAGRYEGKISDNNRAEMNFVGRFEVPPRKRTASMPQYYTLHLQQLEDIRTIPPSEP